MAKKETAFEGKLDKHFSDVKSANGQPLNDKRNGASTTQRWDKQSSALRTAEKSIKVSQKAILDLEGTQVYLEKMAGAYPPAIIALVKSGKIKPWTKHANTFFVDGVEKGRIFYEPKKHILGNKFANEIPNQAQRTIFVGIYNKLWAEMKDYREANKPAARH